MIEQRALMYILHNESFVNSTIVKKMHAKQTKETNVMRSSHNKGIFSRFSVPAKLHWFAAKLSTRMCYQLRMSQPLGLRQL